MRATHLQVEYLTEPPGLGNPKPRFYRHCEGGIRQTAYQILCTVLIKPFGAAAGRKAPP